MLELILTAGLLFGVTTFVRFVVGASPISRALPQIHVQLFLMGALVAVLDPAQPDKTRHIRARQRSRRALIEQSIKRILPQILS